MLVREVMTSSPLTIDVTDKIIAARQKLLEQDIRHLPVVDGGRLVGILSERDLPPAGPVEAPSRAAMKRGDSLVSGYMSSDVLSVYPDSELADAIDLMLEHRIGAVPVVDVDDQELVGILSYVDVLRAARRAL
jgi:CBS domain-containing protein